MKAMEDKTIMYKLIMCIVACACVTFLGFFKLVPGSACVGVIMAAMGYFAGRYSTPTN